MEPKNREQRRREKYGKPGGATKSVWPTTEVNPALKRSADDQAPPSAEPDKDVDAKRPADAEAEGDAVPEEGTHSDEGAKG
jgi:hypothetical protein